MTRMMIFLDACVLINLAAASQIVAILRATEATVFVCSAVQTESLYIRSDDPEHPDATPIDLAAWVELGVIQIASLASTAEEVRFVDLAASLDDGEAMTMALCLERGGSLATDDRKARRIFVEAAADPSRLLTSSDLIRRWSESSNVTETELRKSVNRIRQRARFVPPEDDPNYEWWMSKLSAS